MRSRTRHVRIGTTSPTIARGRSDLHVPAPPLSVRLTRVTDWLPCLRALPDLPDGGRLPLPSRASPSGVASAPGALEAIDVPSTRSLDPVLTGPAFWRIPPRARSTRRSLRGRER